MKNFKILWPYYLVLTLVVILYLVTMASCNKSNIMPKTDKITYTTEGNTYTSNGPFLIPPKVEEVNGEYSFLMEVIDKDNRFEVELNSWPRPNAEQPTEFDVFGNVEENFSGIKTTHQVEDGIVYITKYDNKTIEGTYQLIVSNNNKTKQVSGTFKRHL